MTRPDRFLILLIFVIMLVTVGCRHFSSTKGKPGEWRLLKAGSITQAPSNLPQEGAHLFQTESDLGTWAQQYGVYLPTGGVDFSKHTVAILVRRYSTFEPMIKAVEINDGVARVVLADDPSKAAPVPSLPAELYPNGYELRQYVAVQLPKVTSVILIEEKPIP